MITCHGRPRGGGGKNGRLRPTLGNLWGPFSPWDLWSFSMLELLFSLWRTFCGPASPYKKIPWHVHVIIVINIQISIIGTILVHVNSVCTIIHVRVVSAIHRGASAHTVVLFTSSLVVLHTHVDLILSLLFCKCV